MSKKATVIPSLTGNLDKYGSPIRSGMTTRILAIETSCDETSAAVIEGVDYPEIKTNIIASQIDIHKITGGVVPEVAARAHCEAIIPVIEQALGGPIHEKIDSVDAIAVTVGPGLVGSLLVGVETAKALAFATGKPLIPVNHLEGHIFSALAEKMVASSKYQVASRGTNKILNTYYQLLTTKLPAIGLVVSGGHTELVLIKNMFDYEIIGQTLDDAAGEAFDKVGTLLGLEYPCGPKVSELAEKHRQNVASSKYYVLSRKKDKNTGYLLPTTDYRLPRPMLRSGNLDFSFSGLKTAVVNLVHSSQFIVDRRGKNHPRTKNLELPTEIKQAIAYEFQEAVVEVLVEKTWQAVQAIGSRVIGNSKILSAKSYQPRAILLTGGVSANKRLREAFKERFGDKLLISPLELCGDNAGMIGLAAWWRIDHSIKNYELSIKGNKKNNHNTYFMIHNSIAKQYGWKSVDVDPNLEL